MLILANVAIHDDDYVQENYDGEHSDDDDGDDMKQRRCRIEIKILSGVRVAIFPLPSTSRDIRAHAILANNY